MTTGNGAPLQLRQPAPDQTPRPDYVLPQQVQVQPQQQLLLVPSPDNRNADTRAVEYKPGEFEAYAKLPLFGTELVNELASGATDFSPIVPPDYVIQPGDEIQLTVWGSVDADLRLVVDRGGRVVVPRVGPVGVAGVRFGDLRDVLYRRVSQVFRNFELSVAIGRLRGVRVYVTGFVRRPGAYVVSALSTVMNSVMRAGGPSSAGSFRQIQLRRGTGTIVTLDLYDLLLRGDRSADRVVQPDDVIHVLASGPKIAISGSVNKPAVFELKPGETLVDSVRMAGGLTPVADRTRVALERLSDRNSQRTVQLALPDSESLTLVNGDIVRVFSAVEASLSIERQNRRVRVEGEVAQPGEFVLPPGSTVSDALVAAGGLTPSAFLFGTQFSRESARLLQKENYDRALRDLETDFARLTTTQRVSTPDEAAIQASRSAATTRLIERLRTIQPTGRIVLQIAPEGGRLPDLVLEDGDRLLIPARPTSVGVFGSVFNAGSYLYAAGRSVGDFLRLAGGPTKGADSGSTFVIRANGQVISSLQTDSWFDRGSRLTSVPAEPGDSVFVPEEMDKTTFLQVAKDWTSLIFQFGVGAAGLRSALR